MNIDHIATLRQARIHSLKEIGSALYPDPLKAAIICRKAGVHSIVMHLREDRRHIQDIDLFRVREQVKIRLNLEMSIADSVVCVALRLKPDQVTLVPEKRQEKTTEGGLDLIRAGSGLSRCIKDLKHKKMEISLFIDPSPEQIREAARLGAEAVEFHTGDYANQKSRAGRRHELTRLERAVALAQRLGLAAHAGHGLDYDNVAAVARIEGIGELNIGYSIVSRALWTGFDRAVKDMLELVSK